MAKLKNYNSSLQHFVIFLTFLLFISCGGNKIYVSKIEGKKIGITNENKDLNQFEDLIKPYRENIDKDLNTVLAYAPETIDKNGEWQTTIGNLLADNTLEKAIQYLLKEKIKISIYVYSITAAFALLFQKGMLLQELLSK